jgi:hypothetical protein
MANDARYFPFPPNTDAGFVYNYQLGLLAVGKLAASLRWPGFK